MVDLPSANDIGAIAAALAPGFIILGVRERFREGPVSDLQERVLQYIFASAAYFALVSPLFNATIGPQLDLWVWGALHFALAPFAIGIVAAYFDQHEFLRRLTRRVGLRLPHDAASAWDYAFARLRVGTYVIVTLSDGATFAGLLGSQSFASSVSEERDLLLEQVWQVPDSGDWQRLEPYRSVLICGKEVRHIEFFEGS